MSETGGLHRSLYVLHDLASLRFEAGRDPAACISRPQPGNIEVILRPEARRIRAIADEPPWQVPRAETAP